MQTLLIVSDLKLSEHSGEEYDDYLVFEAFLNPSQMPVIANKIRNKIRELSLKTDDRTVKIFLDITPPYYVVIVGLSKTMGEEENINLILPEELKIQEKEA